MLFWWTASCCNPAEDYLATQSAIVTALKLWGHCFHYLTGQKRENALKITDPDYEDMVKENDLFDSSNMEDLFGRSFLLVQETNDDSTLSKNLGRGISKRNYRT